jgi:hypothetical protein
VRHRLYFLAGQPAELIHIAEAIQKGCCPRVSAACGVGGLGDPQRFAGFILVTKTAVICPGLAGPSR